jgi:hypothetical protein
MSTMKIGVKPKIRITLSLNNTSCPLWDLELTTHFLERFEIMLSTIRFD